MDSLDDQKKKLEIQKLQLEINQEKIFPSKFFLLWKELLPSIITLLSVVGTIFILFKTNVFETNEKLIKIETLEYKQDTIAFSVLKKSIKDSTIILNHNIQVIRDSLRNDKIALGIISPKLNFAQRNEANAAIENGNLKNENVQLHNDNSQLRKDSIRLGLTVKFYEDRFQSIGKIGDYILSRLRATLRNQGPNAKIPIDELTPFREDVLRLIDSTKLNRPIIPGGG